MNETAEQLNTAGADLVFVSFEFVGYNGLKRRGFTWLVRGAGSVNGCATSGASWRLLGNQRAISLRTDTIALYETTYSQQFGTRKDGIGSGVEFYIGTDHPSVRDFTHVLVSGPGLPSDGVVFFRIDGDYLYATTTLLAIRQAALRRGTTPNWLDSIVRTVKDTRSYIMTDAQVTSINDAYYDSENVYTYRFFADYADLFPSLTLVDVLPKRPYLSSEVPVGYYPSLAVNLDTLVTSLQKLEPVPINWSLPLDLRGRSMIPEVIFFSRFNCREARTWPSCAERTAQFNEYAVAPVYLRAGNEVTMTITPEQFAAPNLTTFKGFTRLRVWDSLNRPLERRTGMDYTR